MKIIDFKVDHLTLFDWREDEYEMYGQDTEFMGALERQLGEGYTAVHDGRIVVIGGYVRMSRKTAYGVLCFSKWCDQIPVSAARMLKKFTHQVAVDCGYHRITTRNRAHYDEFGLVVDPKGHNRWTEWLGFTQEGIERRSDDTGNDYIRYGKLIG